MQGEGFRTLLQSAWPDLREYSADTIKRQIMSELEASERIVNRMFESMDSAVGSPSYILLPIRILSFRG